MEFEIAAVLQSVRGVGEVVQNFSDPWAVVAALVYLGRSLIKVLREHLAGVQQDLSEVRDGINALLSEQQNRKHSARAEDIASRAADIVVSKLNEGREDAQRIS